MSQHDSPSQMSMTAGYTNPAPSTYAAPGEHTISERGTGGAAFAAILMIIAGAFGALQGLAYLVKGDFYNQPKDYWIDTGSSTWGWWHLIIGGVVLVAGFGILSAAAWARWLGIVLVSAQAVTNFLFIPVEPFWALTLIAVDLWIIHSLFVHRRERF